MMTTRETVTITAQSGADNYSLTEISVTGVFSAIGGGLIGALIAWLLLRHRYLASNWRRGRHVLTSGPVPVADGFRAPSKPLERTRTFEAMRLEDYLPPPVSDDELENDLSRLATSIRNHANGYYYTPSSTEIVVDESSVASQISDILGPDQASVSSQKLVRLLASAEDRVNAVRFLVSRGILRNITPNSDPTQTLLPPEIASCMRSMGAGGLVKKDTTLLESKWRHITGARTQTKYAQDNLDERDRRWKNITKLAANLETILKHYAKSPGDEKRALYLREIIISGARYGYRLVTQPTTWYFDWSDPEERLHWLVVFPRLIQIGDEEGNVRDEYVYLGELHVVETSGAI